MSSFQRDTADLTPQQWGRSDASGNLRGLEPTYIFPKWALCVHLHLQRAVSG